MTLSLPADLSLTILECLATRLKLPVEIKGYGVEYWTSSGAGLFLRKCSLWLVVLGHTAWDMAVFLVCPLGGAA